jgi:hypothetical protein
LLPTFSGLLLLLLWPALACRYPERTKLNVQESDGTAIFSRLPLSAGTKLTADLCQRLAKRVIVGRIDRRSGAAAAPVCPSAPDPGP